MTPAPNKSGYAPVNGINMYYELYGSGRPLVLIHGGGSTIQTSFATIIPALARNHLLIAVELQAHGRTSDRDAPESFAQDASDVVGMLKHLQIEKADFMGFSNGGQTCMQIAISYPRIVNKLVIVSAFYARDGAFDGFFDLMPNATLDNMPSYLKDAFRELNSDPHALQRMFEKDKQRMVEFKGWSDDEIESIQSPALIVAGSNDVVTREHTVKMSRKMKNSELMILPGNHGSFIGEGEAGKTESKIPALAAMAIDEFLGKTD